MKKSIAVFILLATLLGIFALSASASTFGIGVSTIANDVKLIKTGLIGKKLSFSDTDFKTALGLTDFERVKIITIPSSLEGTLTLAGRRVGEGQTVSRRNIASLSFMPASKSVTECRFTFALASLLCEAGHKLLLSCGYTQDTVARCEECVYHNVSRKAGVEICVVVRLL